MSKNEFKEGVYDHWKERIESNPTPIKLAMLEEAIADWKKNVRIMEDNQSQYSGNHIEKVERRLDINKRKSLVSKLKELLEKYRKSVDNWEENGKESRLPKECLNRIREISEKHSAKGSDWIYEEAYKCKECQFEIKDGEKKKIGSMRTLSRRVKEYYPALHKRTFKQ